MEEQRKRTMEAIEQRFAQAKAELEAQQQKGKKRLLENKETDTSQAKAFPSNPKIKKPSLDFSSKKGNTSFLPPKSKQEEEVNEPAYLKLSHSVDENLLNVGVEVSDRKDAVNKILHELLRHGDNAEKYMQGSKSLKIENTILLDNLVQKSRMLGGGQVRALQKASKRSRKHMSRKQQKRSGLFDLPEEFHNFEFFKPMHEMWKSYTLQLLKTAGKDQVAQCLLNADLHGAIVLVVQCKIESYMRIHGIMIRETKETLGIISQDNKFRVVPKKCSVFVLQVDCWKITLLGDKLSSRNLVP